MVVHVQTKDNNRNFSSAKAETFGNVVHTQIISNWQTITPN